MDGHSERRQTISWLPRDDFADTAAAGGRKWRRVALSVAVLPLIFLGSVVLHALRGAQPRISGHIGRAEKTALRRALRERLDALTTRGTAFRLSAVLPFAWRRVHVVGAMEDARAAFPHLDDKIARRLGSERSDVLVILREPDGLVRIDLGTDHSLVAARAGGPGGGRDGDGGLGGHDIIVSPIHIAGVRHLQLAEVGASAAPTAQG
ncbi:MAG: hypothetical protein U1E42_04110 [Rhodospirillales bacterium]